MDDKYCSRKKCLEPIGRFFVSGKPQLVSETGSLKRLDRVCQKESRFVDVYSLQKTMTDMTVPPQGPNIPISTVWFARCWFQDVFLWTCGTPFGAGEDFLFE